MQPTFSPLKPLFQSIAEWLEDAILSEIYNESEQVPSITEISVQYNINPATALKGVNMLVDTGLLYKKRGMGIAGRFEHPIAQLLLAPWRSRYSCGDLNISLLSALRRSLQVLNTSLLSAQPRR